MSYQIYSRSTIYTELQELDPHVVHDLSHIDTSADIYLICVYDDAVSTISHELSNLNLSSPYCVAHTSGTKPSTLSDEHRQHGVIYPLQTLRKEKLLSFKEIPLSITGNNAASTKQLEELTNQLSEKSMSCSDDYRSKLHVPAVIVNNFVNQLYHTAQEYCRKQSVDFELLKPLMNETLAKLNEGCTPKDMQTGPAVRGDFKTINNHIRILKKLDIDPDFYESITKSIINSHKS